MHNSNLEFNDQEMKEGFDKMSAYLQKLYNETKDTKVKTKVKDAMDKLMEVRKIMIGLFVCLFVCSFVPLLFRWFVCLFVQTRWC